MSEIVNTTSSNDNSMTLSKDNKLVQFCIIAGVEYIYDKDKEVFCDQQWNVLTTQYGNTVSEMYDRWHDYMAQGFIPVIFDKESWDNAYIISPKRCVWIIKENIVRVLGQISK